MSFQETEPSPKSPYPIYFAGGIGYNHDRNEGVLAHIQSLGYDTLPALPNPDSSQLDTGYTLISGGQTTHATAAEARLSAHAPEVELSISHYQLQRADALITMLEAKGGQKTDAIFQSADTLMGVLAAHARPDLFRNIILAYPILGEAPNMNDRGLVARTVAREAFVRLKPTHIAGKRAHRFTGHNPKPRGSSGGTTAVYSVGYSKQSPLLHELRQQEDAPGVGLLLGLDDVMLSPERIFASLQSGDVDAITIVNTPHGMNGRKDVLDATLSLLGTTEQISKKRQASPDEVPPLADRVQFAGNVSQLNKDRILRLATAVDVRSAA
ncbi:hypothetical protein EYC58_00610 [Candidatus Saccharibacteria bacterium]|nr:MAG: hypothetical protein EYC58_00610 [Candidatus Saccharibacteria bacterium]